jgi:hypothetical protein
VERGAIGLREAIRRATATEDVCTWRAALGGPVAMFVLAVTQPATDDVNATSANPRETRLAASTHVFGIRNPPSMSHVSRLSVRIPHSRVRTLCDHGNKPANKAVAVEAPQFS